MPGVHHWDKDKAIFVANMESLGGMLALDAVVFNEDRHEANILLQPEAASDPDDLRLKVWVIDFHDARVRDVDKFRTLASDVPRVQFLAPGIPLDLVEHHATAMAQRIAALSAADLVELVALACAHSRERRADELARLLVARCQAAPQLTRDYLAIIQSET